MPTSIKMLFLVKWEVVIPTLLKNMFQRERKIQTNCPVNVLLQHLDVPLGRHCLLGTPVTCAWPQQYWECFVSLRGTRGRPQNRNVLIRGLESASRWHARVLSNGVCVEEGGEFWNNKTSLSTPDDLLWTWF